MNLIYRGDALGTVAQCVPDMAYLERRFARGNNAAGAAFTSAAVSLDERSSFEKCEGIETILKESPDGPGMVFLVMSLHNGSLFGRRMAVYHPHPNPDAPSESN